MKTLWRLSIAAGFMLSLSSSALACSCMPPEPEEALRSADAVFFGTVTSIQKLTEASKSVEDPIIVTVEVEKIWKGPRTKTIQLHTFQNKFSCRGYFFDEGKKYLVFASRWDPSEFFRGVKTALGVSLCGGTTSGEQAEKAFPKLGDALTPQ